MTWRRPGRCLRTTRRRYVLRVSHLGVRGKICGSPVDAFVLLRL